MWHSCHLDPDNCLDLHQILKVFSAPITEEHAWALVHQTVEILDTILDDDQSEFYRIENAGDIIISVEGSVHFNTFYLNRNNRNILRSESLAIADLGTAIYDALDYSLDNDEQRALSSSLENLIDKMTSADDDADDEGIDDDEDTMIRQSGQCSMVLDLCRHHLASKSEAECHYKAVCRALVAEALEISTFMEKMRSKNENNEDLNELEMGDWANIWTDVMVELRNGIKLKKVTFSKTPTEYEMTPYEMLMADIRKKKKLNPTRIPPRVKTDAKDLILDFIRSRPPLKPAASRKLAPKVDDSTPMEKLMQEIRTTDPSKCLKKTETKTAAPRVTSIKKTIKPDESFYKDILNFDDDCNQDDVGDVNDGASTSPLPPQSLSTTNESKLPPNSRNISEVTSPIERTKARTSCKPLRKPLSSKRRSVIGGSSDQLESVRLSLFEFSHIRVQETRAELECCEDEEEDGDKRADLEMGRVCFCCKTVRFRMLNWAYNCHFCKKNVCSGCLIRLKLPVEKLREVTVASLMSQLTVNNDSSMEDNFVRSSLNRISGNNPPSDSRKSSLPVTSPSSASAYRPRMIRSGTTLTSSDGRGAESGQLRSVCINCKLSLVNTIRSMSDKCRQSETIIPGIKM